MEKKTNIIYIVNSLLLGGTQKVLIDNANNLDFNKYNVYVISLSLHDEEKSVSHIIRIDPNIKLHYFNYSFFDTYSIFGYIELLIKRKKSFNDINNIINLVHSIKPDIVHFHTSPRELIIKKFLKFNTRYVFTDHTLRINNDEYGFLKSRILAFVFRKLYAGYRVITVSEEIKNSLVRNKIVDINNEVVTILNGINLNEYKKQAPEKRGDKLVAVYVSRIDNNKGHVDLIKAWALLKNINNKCLYIVGPDGLNGEIQRVTEELGCLESVIFTGSVSNPKEYICKASIGVFPSYKEGLPLALLEMMAMKLAVVVSDINELKSIITERENGLTFILGNSSDLAKKINYLYSNPSVALLMGENARETVKKKYNSINNAVKLQQFYDSILN